MQSMYVASFQFAERERIELSPCRFQDVDRTSDLVVMVGRE